MVSTFPDVLTKEGYEAAAPTGGDGYLGHIYQEALKYVYVKDSWFDFWAGLAYNSRLPLDTQKQLCENIFIQTTWSHNQQKLPQEECR